MANEPNRQSSGTGAAERPLQARVQQVIDEMINPAVAMHGGFISLVEVKDDTAYVEMGGGCQGCAMSRMTLKAGIETMLKQEIPELREVIDVTDHAGGDQPFFSGAE